jgi:Asp-tRNA(Asn)/Glu-tRNA(Gln) amidotransferase A subunit family amidase
MKRCADAALLLKTIAGYDARDATSETAVPDYEKSLHQSIKGCKIGLIKEIDLASCDPKSSGV